MHGHTEGDSVDDRTREVLPLIAWVASLGVAIAAFSAMGGEQLAAPPVTDPGAWGDWAADRDAVVATVAVLRVLVLAMAWYLVGVTTVGALARVARWTRLVRVADALSVPAVRRVLQASLGVGLATTVVVSSTGAAVTAAAGPTTARASAQAALDAPMLQPVEPDAAGPGPAMTPVPVDGGPGPAPPGMRPLPQESPAPTMTTIDPAPDAPADPLPDSGTDADAATTVTVQVGDHLWSIAHHHLDATRGPGSSDEQIADHWRRIVDANRDRLVDPANPDLILPGQEFVLPAVPGSQASR